MQKGALEPPVAASAGKPELAGAARDRPQITIAQLADIYARLTRAFPKNQFHMFGGGAVKMLCPSERRRPISDLDIFTDIPEIDAFTHGWTFESEEARVNFERRATANGFTLVRVDRAPMDVDLADPDFISRYPTDSAPVFYLVDKKTGLKISLQASRAIFAEKRYFEDRYAIGVSPKDVPVIERPYQAVFLGTDGLPVTIKFVHPALQIINKGMLVSPSDRRGRGDSCEKDLTDLIALLQTFYDGKVDRFLQEECRTVEGAFRPLKEWETDYPNWREELEEGKAELIRRVTNGRRLSLERAAEEARRGQMTGQQR